MRRQAIALGFVAGLLGFAGCATPAGYQVANKSSSTAADAAAEVAEVRTAIARAGLALDKLELRSENDPRATLTEYVSAVAAADASWNRATDAHEEFMSGTDAYFHDWAQRTAVVDDERMRETANNRREEMMDTVSRLRAQFTETRAAFEPHLTQLKNLRTMLQNDFTEAGVAAADRAINDTRDGAGGARATLDELAEVAGEVAGAFSTAGASDDT
ncbi:MAG: hypothetical protein ACREIA_09990 [Opitutaceae bacterium]